MAKSQTFFCVLSAYDGSIVLETTSQTIALAFWNPGTWFGRGVTRIRAKANAIKQFTHHKKIVGEYRPHKSEEARLSPRSL